MTVQGKFVLNLNNYDEVRESFKAFNFLKVKIFGYLVW